MSRVGKHPVTIPQNVNVDIISNTIEVKGPKGVIKKSFDNSIKLEKSDNSIVISATSNTKYAKALWGTARRVIANMVFGVNEGFVKILEINGVGYKAAIVQNGNVLKLSLGYSHDIHYIALEGITLKTTKPTEIEVSGIDRQTVNQAAAEIREFRKPEPYKGKGIKYSDETIIRKEGKKK